MFRKILLVLALAGMLRLPVLASDSALPGDILVSLRDGEAAVTSGSVELCRAGNLTEDGFLLGEEFGGGFIAMEDVHAPDFALWMSRKAGLGLIGDVDGSGTVRFPAMEPGLYLVRQRIAPDGYYSFRPYLVAVTGEMALVDTYPVMEARETSPSTAESRQPYLAALGVAATLAGFIFWDEARRRELRDNRSGEI